MSSMMAGASNSATLSIAALGARCQSFVRQASATAASQMRTALPGDAAIRHEAAALSILAAVVSTGTRWQARRHRNRAVSSCRATNGNAEEKRSAVVLQEITDYDRLLFKNMVLKQASRGRILSPWESVLFHVRTSKSYTAWRNLTSKVRQSLSNLLPFRKRNVAVNNVRQGNTAKPQEDAIAPDDKEPLKVAMLGTRDCSPQYQHEIETLSEARLINGEHVVTSGSRGTNAAVIRGAMKAGKPELLTVVLPQSLSCQDSESRALLKKCLDAGVEVIEMSSNDGLPLAEAARLCNRHVLQKVDKLVSFVSLVPQKSDRYTSLIKEAKESSVSVTTFYLD
eukprot:gb/GFBE01029291.1/.p1 GENE.gb/GFBE01029291.1/~~gb/GFBE01029291.1/.p1  ORF type:complete len:339 (+),score=60.94 gb/GFBE01029291.1/:1-1017(+)